jgi:hypothetical protein
MISLPLRWAYVPGETDEGAADHKTLALATLDSTVHRDVEGADGEAEPFQDGLGGFLGGWPFMKQNAYYNLDKAEHHG